MIIVHDALSYKNLGEKIYRFGWKQYFIDGPTREPLYPFIISISMKLGSLLSTSYKTILIIIQLTILFLTFLLTTKILNKLKINPLLSCFTLLYIGLSPAILNSALSGFSEIAAYPSILGIILINTYIRDSINKDNTKRIIFFSLCLGIMFTLITFVKATYSLIVIIFLLPYIYLLLKNIKLKNKITVRNLAFLIFISFFIFKINTVSYKLLNKKYNGQYIFTNRGSEILLNSATLRSQELNSKRLLADIVSIPGSEYCIKLFGKKECSFWDTYNLQGIAIPEVSKIRSTFLEEKHNKLMVISSLKKIIKNPFQFPFLMFIDALKMFFWESTRVGFVIYPSWLEKLYDNSIFKKSISFISALLSLFSFFYILSLNFKHKDKIFKNETINIMFFISIILTSHIFLYSFFCATVQRHVLPIAPLLVIAITFTIQSLINKKYHIIK